MTFRAKSKSWQWMLWFCAALMVVTAYVVISQFLYGSVSWNILLPRYQRVMLPLLVLFWIFARETRWEGTKGDVEDESSKGEEDLSEEAKKTDEATIAMAAVPTDPADRHPENEDGQSFRVVPAPVSNAESALSQTPADAASGEELFNQARALPHQEIPDFDKDAVYLDLLGKSAVSGYAPALAKLGEYAMRRAAWVEAYYWMKQAQRYGMHGISPILREIRKNWSLDDFPSQISNVSEIFTIEAGSLGRALLHLDSGYEAAKAKEFLKKNHPEYLA